MLDSICVTVSFGNVYLFRGYCTMFIVIDGSVEIVRWRMKNVDVAQSLIDAVREGQKLNKMTSMLLSHPGFESICPNSWVLVTATVGLKTKQKKAFTTFFAEGNATDT